MGRSLAETGNDDDAPIRRCARNFAPALAVFLALGGTPAAGEENEVSWSGAAPPAAEDAQTIRILGHWANKQFKVSEILPEPPPVMVERARPLAIGMDLGLLASAFGGNGRATLSDTDGGYTLSCDAGSDPAGLLLERPGFRLPGGAALEIRIEGRFEGRFAVGVSDAARSDREDPLILGAIESGSTRVGFPGQGIDYETWRSFSIHCPDGAGQLSVNRIEIGPAASSQPGPRATWVWRPEDWQKSQAGALKRLSSRGFGEVFLTVPLNRDLSAVADPAALARFIRAAGEVGISVWSVQGDPRAVLPSERSVWIKRVRAIEKYNTSASPDARLAGLQLDVEPYILPRYERDRAAVHTLYVELMAALRTATSLQIHVAMPFWFAEARTTTGMLLDELDVDSITVMDYRTDPVAIQHGAIPFLEWGSARSKQVRIALEYGWLPDKQMMMFRRADEGRLHIDPVLEGSELTLRAKPSPNPDGAAFRLVAEWAVPASLITFNGKADALWQTVAEMERVFVAWPSFAGMAVHEPPD